MKHKNIYTNNHKERDKKHSAHSKGKSNKVKSKYTDRSSESLS